MTKRLYDTDPYLREFDARVKSCVKQGQEYRITLEESAFFPEGGGQPGDTGFLGAVEVLDTQEEAGEVYHICDRPLPAGIVVHGKINWEKRFHHMQQHSGEHIFSGIFCRRNGANNIGFHMGRDGVTVDFDVFVSEEELKSTEQLTNEKIRENVKIHAWYPSKEELEILSYRSKKEIDGDLRIVEIPGADICACCGTHTEYTGEIQLVKVTGCEHYKNGIRINLLIGGQALDDYLTKHEVLSDASALLSVPPYQVADGIRKLLDQIGEMKAKAAGLQQKILQDMVDRISVGSEKEICFSEELNSVEIRKLADAMADKAELAAVFSGNDTEGYRYVICSRGQDVVSLGKRLNQELHGRGGGKNPMIQGSLSATEKEIRAFFR